MCTNQKGDGEAVRSRIAVKPPRKKSVEIRNRGGANSQWIKQWGAQKPFLFSRATEATICRVSRRVVGCKKTGHQTGGGATGMKLEWRVRGHVSTNRKVSYAIRRALALVLRAFPERSNCTPTLLRGTFTIQGTYSPKVLPSPTQLQ